MLNLKKLIPHRTVHFVGIGGSGMSALAAILLECGYKVSGSDIRASTITRRLEHKGAKVWLGHKAENLSKRPDAVIYSSCIRSDNIELILARKNKIALLKRGQLLAYLMREKKSIAIAGAHGKTTTTALIALLLKNAGLAPSFAVGADVTELSGNAQAGKGEYFVAEADESDASFLYLTPDYGIITNIDREHLDYYGNLRQIIKAYAKFIKSINEKGFLLCGGEDRNIKKALAGYRGKLLTYGLDRKMDICASDISCREMSTAYKCYFKGKFLGKFYLRVPGAHNVINSLACVGMGLALEIPLKVIKKTLAAFSGANRRFQIKNKRGPIIVIDDYAHHPTEIMATLAAAKAWKGRRLVSVFQPHRYSRTKFLKKEFGSCFALTDHLVITDIYAASEVPIKGVEAKTIYDQVKKCGHKDVHLLSRDKINEHIINNVKAGDLLMVLGAGDISSLSDELIDRLASRKFL
ncbi:MAG: UDP-N-acetylmuramate--L-alanine ligase [Candidatus Omnitrophota bacterium]